MAKQPIPIARRVLVVTMDQRQSRTRPDLAEAACSRLNRWYAGSLRLPFVRTAGDEIQAVAGELSFLVDLLLEETRRAEWWVGAAIGGYEEPLGATARDSRGPAFYDARDAVEAAKERPWGFVLGGDALRRVELCLTTTSWIVRKRTALQHEAVTSLRMFGRQTEVARQLGKSQSTVSERLGAAGREEEEAGRELALELLKVVARDGE
jgi:hypothetical protein